ncbi:hypothetical protein, partial [Streptomyces zaomyceticus]
GKPGHRERGAQARREFPRKRGNEFRKRNSGSELNSRKRESDCDPASGITQFPQAEIDGASAYPACFPVQPAPPGSKSEDASSVVPV